MLPTILIKRSEETKKQAKFMLNTKGKCAIIRPTGFGKTFIMCSIVREEQKYKKVMYVYSMVTVKNEAVQDLKETVDKVTFTTYAKLSRINGDRTRIHAILDSYDLIIFDELHHIGAKQAKKTVDEILQLINTNKTHILGSTATPDRMDGFDVIDAFFDNCLVEPYTMNEAIGDKIFPKPYYVYGLENSKIITGSLDKKYKELDESEKKQVKKAEIALANIINAPVIIDNAVKKVYNKVPSYMKWLVFFTDKKILHDKLEDVKIWFSVAYPNKKIRTLIIHSSAEYRDNVNKLSELNTEKDTIDLIFSINMLNEGYHVGDITGVLLLRPTLSSTIYTQQVGRAMSIGAKNQPLVIDFVDNLNTKPLYGVDTSNSKQTKTLKEQISEINSISKENITIVDTTANVKRVIRRLDLLLDKNVENRVVELRTVSSMSVSLIHDTENIPVYKILEIFKRRGIETLDVDGYVWNEKGITDQKLAGYKEYFEQHKR